MSRRFVAAGAAVAAITAGVGVLSAAPTGAAVVPYEDLSGNFTGDDRDEVFSYQAGEAIDGFTTFSNGGVPGGELFFEGFEFRVTGSYDPFVGNFDGDAYDEIFWYSPGTGADSLWNFTGWTTRSTRPYRVDGSYTPVAGDFNGDGIDDILWYRPGTGQDHLWIFDAEGSYTTRPYRVDGTYTPVVGSFGSNATDDILWYRPGAGSDFLWDYNPDLTYTSSPQQIGGTYEPIVLDVYNDGWQGDDIFWYAPGRGADTFWNFHLGERFSYSDPVSGVYETTAGDYFADGNDDILWVHEAGFSVWDHSPTGDPGLVQRFIYDYGVVAASAASSAASERASTTAASGASVIASAAAAEGVAVPATSAGTVESGHG